MAPHDSFWPPKPRYSRHLHSHPSLDIFLPSSRDRLSRPTHEKNHNKIHAPRRRDVSRDPPSEYQNPLLILRIIASIILYLINLSFIRIPSNFRNQRFNQRVCAPRPLTAVKPAIAAAIKSHSLHHASNNQPRNLRTQQTRQQPETHRLARPIAEPHLM